jgi:hypothetical protein
MHFVSSGCSFTYDNHTWPFHFAKKMKYAHYPMGLGSNGNEHIARRAIYQVNDLFKNGVESKDIVVGIMWSAANRASFYVENSFVLDRLSKPNISETSHIAWPKNDPAGKWVLINAGFPNQFAMSYYKFYTNNTFDLIRTYENILRLQNYLKVHNIQYFFSNMNQSTFDETAVNTMHTDYLKEMVDWSRFIPVQGCYEWSRDNMPDDFPVPGDDHPSEKQHEAFVESVVIPFYNNLPV